MTPQIRYFSHCRINVIVFFPKTNSYTTKMVLLQTNSQDFFFVLFVFWGEGVGGYIYIYIWLSKPQLWSPCFLDVVLLHNRCSLYTYCLSVVKLGSSWFVFTVEQRNTWACFQLFDISQWMWSGPAALTCVWKLERSQQPTGFSFVAQQTALEIRGCRSYSRVDSRGVSECPF